MATAHSQTEVAFQLTNLLLRKGEKGFVAGQNGTGKSYLCRQLLPTTGPLCLIDPKGQFEYPIECFDNVSTILRKKPVRFMYRPKRAQIRDYKAYNDLLLYCYNEAPYFLYIDELILLLDRRRDPPDLQTCYQLGRQKGVTILAVTQIPVEIPRYVTAEAQKFYAFTLSRKVDRDRITGMIGEYPLPRSRYEFAFKDIHSDLPPIRLVMPQGL